jgi:hypothetical protein
MMTMDAEAEPAPLGCACRRGLAGGLRRRVVLSSVDLRWHKPHRWRSRRRCAPAAARQKTLLGCVAVAFIVTGILVLALGSLSA